MIAVPSLNHFKEGTAIKKKSDRKSRKMFSDGVKSDCVLWYAETKSPTKVQRIFREKYGRNERTPQGRQMKKWHKDFKEQSVVTPKKIRSKAVDSEFILQLVEQQPRQSLTNGEPSWYQCIKSEEVSEERWLQKL